MDAHNKRKPTDKWTFPPGYAGKCEEAKKRAKAAQGNPCKNRVNTLDGKDDDNCTEADDWRDSDADIMGPGHGQADVRALRMYNSGQRARRLRSSPDFSCCETPPLVDPDAPRPLPMPGSWNAGEPVEVEDYIDTMLEDSTKPLMRLSANGLTRR